MCIAVFFYMPDPKTTPNDGSMLAFIRHINQVHAAVACTGETARSSVPVCEDDRSTWQGTRSVVQGIGEFAELVLDPHPGTEFTSVESCR